MNTTMLLGFVILAMAAGVAWYIWESEKEKDLMLAQLVMRRIASGESLLTDGMVVQIEAE